MLARSVSLYLLSLTSKRLTDNQSGGIANGYLETMPLEDCCSLTFSHLKSCFPTKPRAAAQRTLYVSFAYNTA